MAEKIFNLHILSLSYRIVWTDGTDTCHIRNSEFASERMICIPRIMVGDPGAEYVDVAILFV